METYVEAGAWARLLTEIGGEATVAMSKVLPASESDKLVRLLNKFSEIKCKADDQLFRDFPSVGHDGTAVFYGSLTAETRSKLDEEVIRTAAEKVMSIFDNFVKKNE